jgi:hypothetical protein
LRGAGSDKTNQYRNDRNGGEPNAAGSHALSSLVPRLDGVCVALVPTEF